MPELKSACWLCPGPAATLATPQVQSDAQRQTTVGPLGQWLHLICERGSCVASRDGHRGWSIAVGPLSSSWWQTGLLALSGQLSGHRGTGLTSLAPLGVVEGKLVGGRDVTQSSRIRGDWQAACCSLTAPLGLWRAIVPCKSVQKSGCGDVWVCAGVCRHMVCVCV